MAQDLQIPSPLSSIHVSDFLSQISANTSELWIGSHFDCAVTVQFHDPMKPVFQTPSIPATSSSRNKLELEWVKIPSGEFLMGGIEDDKFVTAVELPRHLVTISNKFFITRYPITNDQWEILMGPSPSPSNSNPRQAPVIGITWQEAYDFCQSLNHTTGHTHRLPTEAEWEYVCRAGTASVFPHGADLTPQHANFLYDESGNPVGPGRIVEVGSYGENHFGVADLLGNVCEWTADHWHADFHGAPDDGSAWIDTRPSSKRVIRGGAWDHLPRVLRASWRDWAPETARWDNLGFRVVR